MELIVDFHSKAEWDAWKHRNRASFGRWRDNILRDVRGFGIQEPLIDARVSSKDITITQPLRESISHAHLNSRKRALLLGIQTHLCDPHRLSSINIRIASPASTSRISRFFSDHYRNFIALQAQPANSEAGDSKSGPNTEVRNSPPKPGSIDLYFSEEPFENSQDLRASLKSVAGLLAPAGFLIAVFPFLHGHSKEAGTASTNQPDARFPGWEILQACRDAGFTGATMTLYASSRFGVVADDVPGVFVLSAWMPAVNVSRRDLVFDAGMINRIAGIAGLPRSGTTVLTAFLAAHSAVSAEFEPWNSRIEHFCHDDPDILRIVPHLKSHQKSSRCLLIKETTTRLEYLRNLTTLLDSVPYPAQEDLVVINRNLQHVFLSEVQGRRDWWGESSLAVTQPVFDEWAKRSLQSLQMLMSVALERNAWMIRYDALTADPAIVGGILESWQLGFESAQFEFHKSLDMRQVRGDQSIVRVPRPISAASGLRRESELQSIESQIAGSPFRERIEVIGAILDSLPGLARAGDCRTALAEILRQTGGA
jgi:hypothetical protein